MDFGAGGVTQKTYYCNPTGTNGSHTASAMMGSSDWWTTPAIEHDSSGNKTLKLKFTISSRSSLVGSGTITKDFALDTIPRGSDISASASSIEVSASGTDTALTITVTPKANTFYNKLSWSLGGNSGSTNLGNSSSTLTKTFSRNDILGLLTNNYNGVMTITCSTYSDSSYSNFVEAKSIPVNVSITLKSTISFTNITGTSLITNKVVAGKSSVQVTGLKLTKSTGATNDNSFIEFSFSSPSGKFYEDSISDNIFSGVTVSPSGVVPSSESDYTITFKARGKDSRKIYTDEVTGTITAKGLKLNLSISGVRVASDSTSANQDPGGAYVKISYSATSLNDIGSTTISSKIYTIQGSSATNITSNPQVVPVDISKYITLSITASIKNGNTVIYPATTITYVVPAASFPLDLYHDTSNGKMGVGLGTLATATKVTSGLEFVPLMGSTVHKCASPGGDGTANYYLKVCTINIRDNSNGNYANSPLEITFARRADRIPTRLSILFSNTQMYDGTTRLTASINYYSILAFWRVGYTNLAYIVPTNSNHISWEIYIQKSEIWDSICILNYHRPLYMESKVTIDWHSGIQVRSVPTGYTQATLKLPYISTRGDSYTPIYINNGTPTATNSFLRIGTSTPLDSNNTGHNVVNGEIVFKNSRYANYVDASDTASGIGCSNKGTRYLVNELLTDGIIAPAKAYSLHNMNTAANTIRFYKYSGTANGQWSTLTKTAEIDTNGLYRPKVSKSHTISLTGISAYANSTTVLRFKVPIPPGYSSATLDSSTVPSTAGAGSTSWTTTGGTIALMTGTTDQNFEVGYLNMTLTMSSATFTASRCCVFQNGNVTLTLS